MAASNARKSSSSGRRTAPGTTRAKSSAKKRKADAARTARDSALFHEIGLIVLCAGMLFLFFCNFGLIGPVGDTVSGILFGMFGLTAYIAPVLLFLAVAFWFANEGDPGAVRKLVAGTVLFVMLGVICDMAVRSPAEPGKYDIAQLYDDCRVRKYGGGVLAGSVSHLSRRFLGTIGTVIVIFLCSAVSLILLTEKSLLDGMRNGGSRIRELTREDRERRREQAGIRRQAQEEDRERRREQAQVRRQEQEEDRERRREQAQIRRQEQDEQREKKEQERRLKEEEKENEKILRMERKVSGVMRNTALVKPEDAVRRRDDIHEIVLSEEETTFEEDGVAEASIPPVAAAEPVVHKKDSGQEMLIRVHKEGLDEESGTEESPDALPLAFEPKQSRTPGQDKPSVPGGMPEHGVTPEPKTAPDAEGAPPKIYRRPPIHLLQKGAVTTGDSARELRETAVRLQQTLENFGVRVTVTDISQGPSVTRYELQPEQGVKVSKVVSLADDIKLNLAALDIRIEAPIPGKAAIGIEVPNKENMPVALRDLLETKEFTDFPSNIAFAVGKDIAGKVVVSDIAKMPHMLIAGATGSGKSVCINTLIMSILYKAHPDDVKLIMVDPKVVELSVYNGIPHLLVPVVTDPKKASAALHWGVAEMEDRYRKFAEYNVRDLKGYNKKVETMAEQGAEGAPKKLPQIVIIVDELADLMMVCPGEVEESICRLAQLARACGIHLIIATQRPSVDVITGLIKANMPSRVAFSVSSGVDSRTILDMVGAERLLGKGDMLFYPQGYSKPARIQGAFVSDQEVSDVVDFLKNQALGNVYAEEIERKIDSMGNTAGGSRDSGGSEVDELFEKAGRLIIQEDKASIGMLQRAFQVGFNRAARIMDQLCQYGVVGEDEGKKPRKILMSLEQFDRLTEEIA